MENFIGKVIKIVSGQDKGVNNKDFWIDDSKCKACYECESAFSQWNRRHHCRICGRVFCGNCSRNSIPPPRESADQQWLRVCNYCYRVRQRSDQPAGRVQHQHAGSRGAGASALTRSGSLRSLPDAASLAGSASADGSSSSLAGSRTKSGLSLSRWSRGATSMHRVSSGDLSWAVPPTLEDDFGMSLADRDARLLYQQQLEAGALPPDAPPQANSLAEVHRQLFCAAAESHLRAVVQQLLMAECVPQPELWAPIVSGAAQAVAAYLSPSQMYANGQHDPRQSLKVKKVADVGRPEDTCVVTGVVVRKGLVHRKMRAYIEYPKVLLLAGSLEYQRETNKLSSFDLMDHDKQYLANAVARLAVVKPDVVLVEGSVARMAQEDLLSRNISVAQKIKMKVLERLARAMGVRVTPTVEHLNPSSAHLYLGDCKVFRVEAETINVTTAGTGAAAPATPPAEPAANGPAAPPPAEPAAASHAASAPSELGQGGFAAAAAAAAAAAPPQPAASAPPLPPRPPADDQGAKYTSLSAAMMMKALGSGPNAAAAVAAVSAGSGVVTSGVTSFPSWTSFTPASSMAASVPSLASPPSQAAAAAGGSGGGGGPGGAAPATAASSSSAPPAGGALHPAAARTPPAPVPAGPPPPPQVPLMYFEGCRPTTSTVLLKGAGLELLRRLKPVVGFAVLTAWNQRLESAFLADLLTAAVAAAGEEAYAAAASAAGLGGASVSSLPSAASVCLGALQLSGGAQSPLPGLPAGPLPSPSLYSPASLSLSLGFFRQHAEAAIRCSLVAASASGAPGILLSISPHCNAWDDSLIAEWEQQGFTFPHLHHHHHHHNYLNHLAGSQHQHQLQRLQLNGHGGHAAAAALQAQAPLLEASPRSQAQAQQQAAEPEEGKAADAPAAARAATDVPALEGELTLGPAAAEPGAAAAVEPGGQQEPQQPAEPGSAAAVAAAVGEALEPFLQPPEYTQAPSATTLLLPFVAAAAAAAGTAGAAAPPPQQPGPGLAAPAQELQQTAGTGQASEPVGEPSVAAGVAEAPWDTATGAGAGGAVPRPEDGGGSAEGHAAGAATEASAPTGESVDLGAARPGVAAGEAGAPAQQQQQPPANATQQGAQDLQAPQPVQQQPHPHQQHQPLQQSAVMVLQGQRIYSHQRIFVTCMFRRSRDRNLCDPFQVKQIDYYHRSSDVPLIRYIKMCTQLGWTCPGVGCPDPFTSHESVFFFGCHKLTIFYSTLPPMQALPGEEKNQIWHWTRPIGRGRDGAVACRRVPLSQDACYISMGRFLELSFSADGLDVFGRSLHYDHVRYFGLGRTLVCMFPERTSVYVMQLPDVVMSYSQAAQAKWLRQEGAELAQEAADAFDLIELMLPESPHFGGAGGGGGGVAAAGWEASGGGIGSAASAVPHPAAASDAAAAAGEAGTGFTPSSSPGAAAAPAAAAAAAAAAAGAAGLASLLGALRKDRQSFLALVADCLARCAPPAAPAAGTTGGGAPVGPWDELLISGVRDLNRLRAVLAKNVLQWASRLQDPAGFAAHYNRITSGGGGGGGAASRYAYRSQPPLPPPLLPQLQPQPQQPSLSSSPRAPPLAPPPIPASTAAADLDAAVAAATASSTSSGAHPPLPPPAPAVAAFTEQPSIAASEGSLSLFGATTPAVAAYRLGLMAGQGQLGHQHLAPASEAASFTSVAASELAGSISDHPHAQPPPEATAAHALPIPIVPHTNGPLSVHAVAEMVAQQEARGGGELLEGSRALLGAAGGAVAAAAAATAAAAAVAATAAAHHAAAAGSGVGHSRGSSRCDYPAGSAAAAAVAAAAEGAAGSAGGALPAGPPPGVHSGGEGARLAPSGASGKRLSASALGRLSTGGGVIPGLDVAVGSGASATLASGHGGGSGGGGGGLRGSSLPRSVSVSTIGDMDISYMGGIGGDSGAEDADDGEEGREVDEEEEEPDHDTFLAFMGSGPHGGSGGGTQAGGAGGGRGHGGAGPGGRSAAASSRGGGAAAVGDSGDDVPDEMADGAYYYRALFSHGVAPEGGEAAAAAPPPQALLQPPHPLVPATAQALTLQRAQQHPLEHGEEDEEGGEEEEEGLQPPNGALATGAIANGALAAQQPAVPPTAVTTLHAAAALAVGTTAEPLPLVPAAEAFAVGSAGATAFSRRQLMVSVKRRLESVAAATVGGGSLARGFIPLPGRATLPPGVNDMIIPIFDGEPTSIIAYALSTRAYQQQINAGYKAIFGKARADSNMNREREREQAGVAAAAAAATAASGAGGVVAGSEQQAGAGAGAPQGGSQASTPTSASAAGAAAGAAFAPAPQPPQPTANSAAAPLAAAAAPAAPQPAALGSSPPQHVPVLPPPAPPPPPPPPAPLTGAALGGSPDAEWWAVLTSKEACHVRVAFEDEARSMPWARARFAVTAHFAPQFGELRRRCIQGGEAAFVASMCRCKRWESRGGKSNAYFAKTRDDRYIIKSLSKSEKASFMNFAPHYFAHMGRHLLNRDSPTCLAKILGVYSVTFKPQPGSAGLEGATGGGPAGAAASAALIKELKDREFSQELLVMENCFYDRPVARIYDLKGSERNRFNADAASRPEDHLEVHLDDNLRRSMHTNPIFVDARSRAAMECAVWADTAFLAGQDVMDYSLLVGVDKENGVLALAIIDFIRQYTWDKQLETWVKSSGMLGGNGKEPTIISPKQYMRRFRAAMQQYFTAVPGSAGSDVPKDPDATA